MSEIGWTLGGFRLLLALLLGGAIGFERGLQGKSAGLRTHMMVALGSALFMEISIALPAMLDFPGADPTRIAAQIITGVGFLGAGSILHAREGIRGLTTAASIWLAAAIGMGVGGGFYSGAILASLLGLGVLQGLHGWEARSVLRGGSRRKFWIRVGEESEAGEIQRLVEQAGTPASSLRILREATGPLVQLDAHLNHETLAIFLESLSRHSGVREIRMESK